MEFLDPALEAYVAQHTSPHSALLERIDRETHLYVKMPRMLSGHVQGRILATFAHMLRPQHILEIGTYTGYSALCFAEGLAPGGQLTTLDINEELESRVRGYFEEAGVAPQIDYRIGNALEVIPTLPGPFDLVFIDADKVNYSNYYQLVIDKVRPGGFIIADNVLWSGKVLATEGKLDKDTKALQAFNKEVHADPRVEQTLFPVRDGLLVVRKR